MIYCLKRIEVKGQRLLSVFVYRGYSLHQNIATGLSLGQHPPKKSIERETSKTSPHLTPTKHPRDLWGTSARAPRGRRRRRRRAPPRAPPGRAEPFGSRPVGGRRPCRRSSSAPFEGNGSFLQKAVEFRAVLFHDRKWEPSGVNIQDHQEYRVLHDHVPRRVAGERQGRNN